MLILKGQTYSDKINDVGALNDIFRKLQNDVSLKPFFVHLHGLLCFDEIPETRPYVVELRRLYLSHVS